MENSPRNFTVLITVLWLVVLTTTAWFTKQIGQLTSIQQEPVKLQSAEEKEAAPTPDKTAQTSLFALPTHPEAESTGHTHISPIEEIAALAHVLEAYSETIGALPTAENNVRVMSQLRGANPAKRAWFPREHPRLSKNEELLDAYGTPYSFHFESSQQATLRSAGPDQMFYTADDLVQML